MRVKVIFGGSKYTVNLFNQKVTNSDGNAIRDKVKISKILTIANFDK